MSSEALKQKAYHLVLERLLDGQLKPGEILNRRAMADDLAMSTAPVTDAMLKLESEGFLKTIPRKGTKVRVSTRDDITGSLVVRLALESQVARIVCGPLVTENHADLHALAKEADASAGTRVDGWKADSAFHATLAQLCGCPQLIEAFERNMTLRAFYGLTVLRLDHDRKARSSHVKLLRDLKTADPDKADKSMRAHICKGKEILLKGLC